MLIHQQQRRGTAAEWASVNPILYDGELGLDKTSQRFKIGDGSTHWAALPYFSDVANFSSLFVGQQTSETVSSASGVAGIHRNTDSPYYGKWYSIGNAKNSMGFAGQGTPPHAYAPVVFYQEYGDKAGLTNAPVLKTTQGTAFVTNYWGPTTDDSAQVTSFFGGLKNTGTPYTQAKQFTGVESSLSVEGANNLAEQATSYGARFTNGTGTVDTVSMFRTGQLVNAGTITNWYGFRQSMTPPGTVTNRWGAYFIDKVGSETGFVLGASGKTASLNILLDGNSDANTSIFLLNGSSSNPGLTLMTLVAGATQTKPILSIKDSGGTARFQWGSTGFLSVAGSGININTSGGVNKLAFTSTALTISDIDIVLSATSGTKLGSSSTEKLGFWGATPVARQARPTDAASIITLLTTLGLCA